MSILIRSLHECDYEIAGQILASAFQRSGNWRSDLEIFHHLQPDGLFLAEYNHQPAGMVAAVIYPAFAYVGLMAVHERNQRQGLGLALMERLLDWLEKKQVSVVKLDASPAGQHLYEQLGFIAQGSVAVFQHTGVQQVFQSPAEVTPLSPASLETLAILDTKAFGTDRAAVLARLLAAYPGRSFLAADQDGRVKGYLCAQHSRIGPWVAMDVAAAEVLLQSAFSLHFPGPVTITVPEENPCASALLNKYGFSPIRRNLHMIRGSYPALGHRSLVYSQASLSLG